MMQSAYLSLPLPVLLVEMTLVWEPAKNKYTSYTWWSTLIRTSGKSTQNAFMFIPYRKLAKLSVNRAMLSCIN